MEEETEVSSHEDGGAGPPEEERKERAVWALLLLSRLFSAWFWEAWGGRTKRGADEA